MDTITGMAMSVDNPVLEALGMFIGNSFAYAALVLALLAIGESRDSKRRKVLLALAIAVVATYALKYSIAQERPCAGEGWCPSGYSFPSTHAAVAFTLMTAFLKKRSYPLYLLFALFVGFTRLNLGVHVFVDVAAALPIAMLSYYIADVLLEGKHG